MKQSIYKIVGYPLIILICWGPSLLYDTTETESSTGGSSNRIVDICNFLFPGLQGLLVTVVFIATNREVQAFIQGDTTHKYFHLYFTLAYIYYMKCIVVYI